MKAFTYSREGGAYSLMALLKDNSVRVDEMGDGFRFGVAIVALALLGKFSTIMLEEPENHQHPRALLRVAQLLTSLTKRNQTQLFITTHSTFSIVGAAIDLNNGDEERLYQSVQTRLQPKFEVTVVQPGVLKVDQASLIVIPLGLPGDQ